MIRLSSVFAILRKDVVDAMRDVRVIASVATPLALGLLYNVSFADPQVAIEVKVALAPGVPELAEALRERAGDAVRLTLPDVTDEAHARSLVSAKDVDYAVVVPADVDTRLRAASTVPVQMVRREDANPAATAFVRAVIEEWARTVSGRAPPVVVVDEALPGDEPDAAVLRELGTRQFFVLATVVMLLGMIGTLVVPIILTEEREKKTLDALVLACGHLDVIVAKALVGLLYCAVSVPLMLAVTRMRPADPLLFGVGALLLALSMVGIGLLIGGLFRTSQQVYTWSSFFLIPILGPAFVVGLPVPAALSVVVDATPAGQAMRLLVNGFSGRALFEGAAVACLVLGAWIVIAFGVLRWRLARQEA